MRCTLAALGPSIKASITYDLSEYYEVTTAIHGSVSTAIMSSDWHYFRARTRRRAQQAYCTATAFSNSRSIIDGVYIHRARPTMARMASLLSRLSLKMFISDGEAV